MGQIILETLENLIHMDLNSMTELEFVGKHALMKRTAIKSIFEQFLSDHSLDTNMANHCYRILQEVIIVYARHTRVRSIETKQKLAR
jgi:signal transduction histidine kinase